jgi:hypothetical protein
MTIKIEIMMGINTMIEKRPSPSIAIFNPHMQRIAGNKTIIYLCISGKLTVDIKCIKPANIRDARQTKYIAD